MLGKRIDELIATNFNLLAALHDTGQDESPGLMLAQLVIARQLEKLKWREKYKQ